MDIEAVQSQLNQATDLNKKIWPKKEREVNEDGEPKEKWVKNDTFTTLKQSQIPNGTFEFRLLPPVEGKNPGLYLVQMHKIMMKREVATKDGAEIQYPVYEKVLGNVTNREMTVLDPVIKALNKLEQEKKADFDLLPKHLLDAVKAFKGEVYFEVPCLFKATHVNRPFKGSGGKDVDWWHLEKP